MLKLHKLLFDIKTMSTEKRVFSRMFDKTQHSVELKRVEALLQAKKKSSFRFNKRVRLYKRVYK